MKKLFAFAMAAMFAGAAFATTAGTDSADNVVYDDGWTTGDDGSDSGNAFGQWTLNTSGSAGSYIGGVGGLAGDSFGLWADAGGSSSALRAFESAMAVGLTFSFVFGHTANVANGAPHAPGNGQMTAFLAATRAEVDAAHAAALAHGGRCAGPPGPRPHHHADYYGAYFRDPDGNKLAVACHLPASPNPLPSPCC